MKTNEAIALVLQFLDRINAADVDSLCSLMTDDHRFGEPLHGQGERAPGWQLYCAWFPDHRVSHEEIFQEHNIVAAFGTSSGTYVVNGKLPIENHWQVPAAWKAVVRNA